MPQLRSVALAELTLEGQVLAGKYRVERQIGQGGMGVVVAATHLQLGQTVALKFLLPEVSANPESVRRFVREARAAARIQSEHIVRVTDVGTLESGIPYIVMEYLKGSDLAHVLTARGPLPVEEAVDYMLQACEALAEAHAVGFVHRDIKPSNLFLSRRSDGSPLLKVLDFGISKATNPIPGAPNLTLTQDVVGSPQYMSPEQIRSARNVDARTDVWSLGVVMYELLTDALVYEADTVSAQLAMIAADPPPPLRSKRPDAPRALETVLLRCLEKDREHRFASVAELAVALAPFGGPAAVETAERVRRILGTDVTPELGLSEVMRDRAPTPEAARALPTVAAWGTTSPSSTRRTGMLLAGSLVLAGLLGMLTVASVRFWGSNEATSSGAPSSGSVPASAAGPAASPVSAADDAPATRKSADEVPAEQVPAAASAPSAAPSNAPPPRRASRGRGGRPAGKDWRKVFSGPE